MTKPASGQPVTTDIGQAGKRRRLQRRHQHHSIAEQSAGEPSTVQHRRTDGLLKSIEQESMVDNEKVRRIKAAIHAGTYVVDADIIAQKLIDLEVELTRPDND